jgi:hypothetical protein
MQIRLDETYPTGLDLPQLIVEGLTEASDIQTAMNNLDLIWHTARKKYPNYSADDLYEMVKTVFEKSLRF